MDGLFRQASRTEPRVQMDAAQFRSFTLRLAGQPNAAQQIVPGAPYFQRVVLHQTTGASGALITAEPNELESPGNLAPGGAFLTPVGGNPIVVVAAPGQALYAATTSGVLTRLSVSASQRIPLGGRGVEPEDFTQFRTYALAPVGTGQARQVVPAANKYPQRVVVRADQGVVFLSPAPSELDMAGQPNPGGAFALLGGGGVAEAVFVVSPGQGLYAVRAAPPAPVATLSISFSQIPVDTEARTTTIPSPNGQE